MIDKIIEIIRKISSKKKSNSTFKALLIDDSIAARVVTEKVLRKTLGEIGVPYELFIFDNFLSFTLCCQREYDLALVDWNLDQNKTIHGNLVVETIRDTCPMISIMSGQSGEWAVINSYAQSMNLGVIKKGKPMQHRVTDPNEEPKYFEDTNVELELEKFIKVSFDYFKSKL